MIRRIQSESCVLILMLCVATTSLFGCRKSQEAPSDKGGGTEAERAEKETYDVEAVKAATKSAIQQTAGSEAAEKADLSYITPELLQKYASAKQASLPESSLTKPADGQPPVAIKGADGPWMIYGHHFVVLDPQTALMGWTNPTSSYDKPDSPDVRCFGDNNWMGYVSMYYIYPSCPPNTQGANSDSIGADLK